MNQTLLDQYMSIIEERVVEDVYADATQGPLIPVTEETVTELNRLWTAMVQEMREELLQQ